MCNIKDIRRLFFFSILCLLLMDGGLGKELPHKAIQGRVLKVLPSPGFWTGVIKSVQWLDIKVAESRVPAIKPDTVIHIGVPVVKGSPLFEKETPQFSSDMVAPGSLLDVKISDNCSTLQEPESYVVEPKCIQVLKKAAKSHLAKERKFSNRN